MASFGSDTKFTQKGGVSNGGGAEASHARVVITVTGKGGLANVSLWTPARMPSVSSWGTMNEPERS